MDETNFYRETFGFNGRPYVILIHEIGDAIQVWGDVLDQAGRMRAGLWDRLHQEFRDRKLPVMLDKSFVPVQVRPDFLLFEFSFNKAASIAQTAMHQSFQEQEDIVDIVRQIDLMNRRYALARLFRIDISVSSLNNPVNALKALMLNKAKDFVLTFDHPYLPYMKRLPTWDYVYRAICTYQQRAWEYSVSLDSIPHDQADIDWVIDELEEIRLAIQEHSYKKFRDEFGD